MTVEGPPKFPEGRGCPLVKSLPCCERAAVSGGEVSDGWKGLPRFTTAQHRYSAFNYTPAPLLDHAPEAGRHFRSPRAPVLLRLCGRHVFVTSTIDNERRL
jgi:hypothetical protein